ncbi:MAG: S1 RNA-binding domain-containing protein [Bdellovibrionales bacterium]|nr:S1 RNA-binding domain-containing protein [Bdellovibrionales bacterium]
MTLPTGKLMGNKKNSDFVDQLNSEFGGMSSEDADASAQSRQEKEDFAKMLSESLKGSQKKLKVGDRIRGKILVLGAEDVFVSTGTQNDGVLNRRELLNEKGELQFKQDDVIDVFVTQVKGSDVRLSRNPTDKNLAEDLEDAFDMMLPVQGRIVEVCKGGVRVNLKGKLAFCPISQIDVNHVASAEEFVGKSFEFRITQFTENGRNIVVSRRKLLEEERELNQGSFLEENKDGQVVQGKVARLEKFGAFVELAPGVDGLVHISEIAWSRIGDPSEVLTVGQEVSVKILKRETLNGRAKISLSIKQTQQRETPATPEKGSAKAVASSKFSIGQIITGKINRKEVYGIFVQIDGGVSGLLHKSKTFDHPEFHYEKLKVGDEVTIQIAEINPTDGKISLQVPRDPNEDDWRSHVQASPQSLGTFGGALGSKLQAALSKKK